MAYAKETTVTVARSKAEIEETVERFGSEGFMSGQDGDTVMLAFKSRGRQVAFRMVMANPDDHTKTPTGKTRSATEAKSFAEKEDRRRWRALALAIKAKLVSVEDGIETFEQAFMANIVMPDGLTIADHVAPRIEQAYETGNMPPLLPGPQEGE